MKKNEHRLDELFESARNEPPKITFEHVKHKHIAQFSGVSKIKLPTSLKLIIMLSIISATIISVFMFSEQTSTTDENMAFKAKTISANIERVNGEPEKEETIIVCNEKNNDLKDNLSIETKSVEIDDLPNEELQLPDSANETHQEKTSKKNEVNSPKQDLAPEKNQTVFTLDSYSNYDDFKKVADEAERVGARFTFNIKRKCGIIKRCTMKLEASKENSSINHHKYTSRIRGDFSKEIGWILDDSGNVSEFIFK